MDYKVFYAEIGEWIMHVNHLAGTHGMESNHFWDWVSRSIGEISNKYGNNKLVTNQLSMLFMWLDDVYSEMRKR